MMEKELYQKFQKLTTQEIYDKAIQLATELNYKAGLSSIKRNGFRWQADIAVAHRRR